jgi:hypothetical protein
MKIIPHIALLAGLTVCGSALAVPITFDEVVSDFTGAGATFWTQGFRFDAGDNNTAVVHTGGSACGSPCANNGTEYLLNIDSGRFAAITMSLMWGGTFSLAGFDAAESFTGLSDLGLSFSAASISVVGTRADGSTVSDSFTLDGNLDGPGGATDFQTFATDGRFSELVSLSFNGFGGPVDGQDGNFYQFFSLDNIDVNRDVQVPEPSTLLLLGTGLLAVFAGRRRRA